MKMSTKDGGDWLHNGSPCSLITAIVSCGPWLEADPQ